MPVASLIKYLKVNGKWQFVPIQKVNGLLRPDTIMVSGKPVKSSEGSFYIQWKVGAKRRRESVGTSPRAAVESLRIKQDELNSTTPLQLSKSAEELTLVDACARFLRDIRATRSDATHRTYLVQTKWFLKHTSKLLIKDITRDDIMELFAKGRDEGSDQKTINKRIVVVLAVLRNAGHPLQLKKGDWPKTADPDPEVYEHEELKKFFAACDDRERNLFMVFLYTGFRHMEVATLQWNGDIDWNQNALKVRIRADLGFSPKSYEWRNVKIPKMLMERLRVWQQTSGGSLMFPSLPHPKRPNYGGGGVDYHMLETCKRVAHRAGLNCGRCDGGWGKCDVGPFCQKFYLHKFRHTFATNMLRSDVDLKSLQTMLGHRSLATTEKYLKSLRLHDLESKVENSTLVDLL